MSYAVSLAGAAVIATYTDLVTAVKAELDEGTIADSQVLEFVQRFEARLNRILRVPDMEKIGSVAVASGSGELPIDFLEMRRVYDSANVMLPGVEPTVWIEALAGHEKVHCLAAGALKIAPASDETVNIVYYGKIPALNIDQQSNWLLESHPDIYFYGVLVLFCSHIANDDGVAKYKAALDEALGELIDAGNRRRFGGPVMAKSPVASIGVGCV